MKIKSPKEIIQKVYDTADSTDLFAKGDIKVRIILLSISTLEIMRMILFTFSRILWEEGLFIKKGIYQTR
ncbi:MAG: hypothetical protein AB8B73_12730 [Ekhidna sp.]